MERSDWQLQLCTHIQRCKYAFKKLLFCDVEFLVVDCDRNNVVVPTNKYPLAVCSPVFEAMFYGKLAETSSPIYLPDCTEEGLREILRYAHYEEANLTGNNVMEVLYLAKKYMMPSLEEMCQHYIRNEVGPEDVLSILPQVKKMNDENLEKYFLENVDANTEQVMSSKSFVNVSRELLCEMLKRDTLKISEVNLFIAVDKWVTKRIEEDQELVCNGKTKRAILGEEVIRMIRFPLMTNKEIAENVLPCQLLTAGELAELFCLFSDSDPKSELFSRKRRSFGKRFISDVRFSNCRNNCWGYSGESKDYLDFTVSKQVDLVGVRLFGSEGTNYLVDLKINRRIQNKKGCMSHVSTSSYATETEKIDGLYYGFTVTLGSPVRLHPGVMYNIEARIDGSTSWGGSNGESVVSASDQLTISYTDASESDSNGTSSTKGQFPSLVLQTI